MPFPPEVYVLLVAALPVVELRGAIPLGVALGLSPWESFLWALLGNLLVVPLPGTGAWSGAVLAVVLGVRRRYAFPALALGVVAAGLLVLLLTGGTVHGLNYLR